MRALKIQVLGLIRYLRPDHNPLRRPLDRMHTRLIALLATLFLITGVGVTGWTVHLVDAAGVKAERQQTQTRHQADAVVIDMPTSSANGFEQSTRLRWQDASGAARTATVAQRTDDRVGGHRTVWIDRTGRLTTRPRTHAQTISDAALAALTVLTTLVLVHAGAYTVANRRLERRRMALWEDEWVSVSPRWTGRS